MKIAAFKPVILVADPSYYVPAPPPFANIWEEAGRARYEANPKEWVADMRAQIRDLRDLFKDCAHLCHLPANKNIPEQIWTADASITQVIWDKARKAFVPVTMISKFANAKRQDETLAHEILFKAVNPEWKIEISRHDFEGTGDCVFDSFRDIFWSGNRPDDDIQHGRSDPRSDSYLANLMSENGNPARVVGLETRAPFYHLDTGFAALSRGHIMVYPQAMSEEAFATLKRIGLEKFGLAEEEYLIKVSEKDANEFALNVQCIGDIIIMPETSSNLRDRLEDLGYEPRQANVECLINGGGAVHCTTNNITPFFNTSPGEVMVYGQEHLDYVNAMLPIFQN